MAARRLFFRSLARGTNGRVLPKRPSDYTLPRKRWASKVDPDMSGQPNFGPEVRSDLSNEKLQAPEFAEPYALELWCEKSTLNDVLVPLAERLQVSLITGVGEMSTTTCHAAARRIAEHGRPTRILYFSDIDPAG